MSGFVLLTTLSFGTLHMQFTFIDISIMFDSSFKLCLVVADLIAITETIRNDVPACLADRLDLAVKTIREVLENVQ